MDVPGSMRNLLYSEWAAVSKWYCYQPLDYIMEYFGVKIGLYFAWLGYYTYMLILASIAGIICVIYSLSTLGKQRPMYGSVQYNSTIIIINSGFLFQT